jgi:hypothetical protein
MTEALKEIVETRGTPESVLCRKVTARYLRLRARALKGQLRDILRPGRPGQRSASNQRQPLAAEQ